MLFSPARRPQGDSLRTSVQLDFGDGIRITYSNLSRADDGIQHAYRATGIYRVTAAAENSLGSDSCVLYLHIISTPRPNTRTLSRLIFYLFMEVFQDLASSRCEMVECRRFGIRSGMRDVNLRLLGGEILVLFEQASELIYKTTIQNTDLI